MRRFFLLLSAFVTLLQRAASQREVPPFTLQGRIADSLSGAGIEGIEVLMPYEKRIVLTAPDGSFRFDGMRPGVFTLCVRNASGFMDTLKRFSDPGHATLPDILIARPVVADIVDAGIPDISVATDDAEVSAIGSGDYAALTQAGRNPFTDATIFNLFAFRFQPRAYDRRTQEVLINSLPMQDPASLYVPWNAWSGLSDAFRNREQRYGLGPSDAAFGGLAGSLSFDLTAATQRPQTRVGYALTNRSYRNRVNYSISSGILPSGWAWSVNVSYRAAGAGFVPGTFYQGASVYAGLSRIFSSTQHLHLSVCGAWSRVGRSAAVTEETVRLLDDPWYNPNWGLQHGRVRNARVSGGFQPFAILTHQYRPGSRFRIETSFLAQAGNSGTTGIDYYNASNPRPDYYRYLPSFLSISGRNPDLAAFYSKPQIDWDDIYQQNRMQHDSVLNAEGIPGNTVSGLRSVYVLYRDVQSLQKAMLGSNIQWKPGPRLQLNAGISAVSQAEQRYRELADLLGGGFYLNTNAFIDGASNSRLPQYDLNTPDHVVRQGDRYNYNYIVRSRELSAWTGVQAAWGRVDLHLELRGQYRGYQREGLFRNGLFPESSFGAGSWRAFGGGSLKAGASYRLSGRSQILINAFSGGQLPGFDQAYISSRVRNTANALASPEHLQGMEAGFMHRSSVLHLHLMVFATRGRTGTEMRRYYSDDPAFASFVNYLMTGVARQYSGLELGSELRLSSLLSLRAAVAVADAFYAANPSGVYIYGDNDTAQVAMQKDIYLENIALASGPQTAGTLGFTYRSTRYWYAGITANYACRSYIDVNPDRRSEAAIRGLQSGSPAAVAILKQEQLPAAYTIDLSAGKNWLLSRYSKRLPKNTYLYLNASLSNVLDRRYRTGGYEQLRFDYAGQNPDKFGSKYFYAPGRNFLISASLRW